MFSVGSEFSTIYPINIDSLELKIVDFSMHNCRKARSLMHLIKVINSHHA